MAFIVKNNEFVCQWCGELNPPAPKTCRNHCRKCFASKHVDDAFPGDRSSVCGGKMEIKTIELSADYRFVIVHQCAKCHKIIKNKTADDDDEIFLMEAWKKQSEKNIFTN